jgi:hypothetical protein
MFKETYGFSARFIAEFWIQEVSYKNPLLQLAVTAVEESFDELGWQHVSGFDQNKGHVSGSAEPVPESKVSAFYRMKLARFIEPGVLPILRMMPDRITWEFTQKEAKVAAEVEFYIRKTTTFANKPEQERLSLIIRRLSEQVTRHCIKYSLGMSVQRN